MHDDTSVLKSILVEFCLDRIARHEDFAKAETSSLEDMFAELAGAMSEALEAFDTRLLVEKPEGWVREGPSVTLQHEQSRTVEIKAFCAYEGKRDGASARVVDITP